LQGAAELDELMIAADPQFIYGNGIASIYMDHRQRDGEGQPGVIACARRNPRKPVDPQVPVWAEGSKPISISISRQGRGGVNREKGGSEFAKTEAARTPFEVHVGFLSEKSVVVETR
jgi:hypothetical protein